MYLTIYNKVNKLLEENEDLAKEYFYNVLTNPETHEKILPNQFFQLFQDVKFNTDDTEFKMSILAHRDIMNVLSETEEKSIFLNLIRNHDYSKYLDNDYLLLLLDRYSKWNGFIDTDFAKVILKYSEYMDEDAVYYVLKSRGVSELEPKLIEQLMDSYDMYEGTMAKRVISILSSEEFVSQVPFRKLAQFIERVSLNLPSNESKKFIVEVIRLQSIKNKYIKSGKFYNFHYKKGNNKESVNFLLIDKGYFKNLIHVSDLNESYELIKFFYNADPLFFEYFDFRTLNDKSMELDKDLLFGLMKSDRKALLMTLVDPKIGDLFVKCANYLNERYPNINVGMLAKVLHSDIVLPEAIYQEVHTHDIAMITNFLLFNSNMYIDSIEEYEYAIMGLLDLTMDDDYSVSSFKNALCINRYGFGYNKVHAYYKLYRHFVENCSDENLKREFQEFQEIIECKDKQYLRKQYMTNIFTFDKANKYEMDIKRLYTEELKKNIISLKDLNPNSFIIHKGQTVPVVELTEDFNLLISAVGFVTNLESINDSYRDSIVMSEHHDIHALSTSLYSSKLPSRVGGEFILGYSDFPDYTIQHASTMDIYSYGNKYNVPTQYPSTFVHPRDFSDYTRHDYNEIVMERRITNEENEMYLSNIYPTYVLLDSKSELDIAAAIKASKEFGIPIVYVDLEKLKKKNVEALNKALAECNCETLEEYLNLARMILNDKHDQSKSGYIYDFPELKVITKKFLSYPHSFEEYLSAEQLLVDEINKGGNNDYTDICECIIQIRKSNEISIESQDCSLNEEYNELINTKIDNLIAQGLLTQRHNGLCINDARAFVHASIFVHKCIEKKYGWTTFEEDEEFIDIALMIVSNISEYRCDFYLNKGDENINFANYYPLWLNMKDHIVKLDKFVVAEAGSFVPIVGFRCTSKNQGYQKMYNIAHSLIEGEGMLKIADFLSISMDELTKARKQLLDIYNYGVKRVESRKK